MLIFSLFIFANKKLESFDRYPWNMSDPNITVVEETTVIEALSILHPNAKKNTLRRMIDYGRVLVDGERKNKANEKITSGAIVTVIAKVDGDQKEGKQNNELPKPEILYSDNSIIVVDKPEGLLSVSTDRGEADTMYSRTAKWASDNMRTRILLVHRLDRETSGCLIFATTPDVRDMLQKQFKNRSIKRIYYAIVHGKPDKLSGVEIIRIQETKDKRVRLVIGNKRAGKEAITNWVLEKAGTIHSLMRIKIDTGRRAQIRLHMANLGCPVLGDTRYGRGKTSVNRLCLHATELVFKHPNGSDITIKSKIPTKLMSELNRKTL